MGPETLHERIRYARKAARLTQAAVASHFKISRVSVTQWENGDTRPENAKMGELAALLNTSTDWLLRSEGFPPLTQPIGELLGTGSTPRVISTGPFVSEGQIPVYAAAMGGNGQLIVSFDPIDTMRRPAILENVKDGYGIQVTGDSMVPAYWQGDIAWVNPHMAPRRDTDAVLYHEPPTGEAEAIIKRIDGFNDREWTLRQWNPSKVFKESRIEWPYCHRVVGKYNAS